MKEVLFIGGPMHGKVLMIPRWLHRFEAADDEDRGGMPPKLWSSVPVKKVTRASYRIEELALFRGHKVRGLFFGVIDGEFTPQECLIEYIRRCVPAAKRVRSET